MMKCIALIIVAMSTSSCAALLCDYQTQLQSSSPNGKYVHAFVIKKCGSSSAPVISHYLVDNHKAKNVNGWYLWYFGKNKILTHQRGVVELEWPSQAAVIVKYDFREFSGRKGEFWEKKKTVSDVSVTYEPDILR